MVSKRAWSVTSIGRSVWTAAALGLALLAGCGGESDSAATPAPVSANSSAGTIAGFSANAVIVNSIHYDKRGAQVLNDDDQVVTTASLKLGMQVEMQANGMDRARGTARAARIAFGRAVVGPVSVVDAGAGTVTVLGQTVQVSEGTVFDADLPNGLADVQAGALLSVFGLLDAASGVTTATRIELESAVRAFRLRGVVSELDEANKTLKIGGQPVSFANIGANKLPKATLADGQVVRAVLETAQVDGQFVARSIKADRRFVADGQNVDIETIVTQFTSATSFKVVGLPVDATGATFVNEADLKRGARVRVQGALVAGVLVATNVEVKVRGQQNVVELSGAVANLNANKKTFTLNDVTVDFGGRNVAFVGGAAADLADGVQVVVSGKLARHGTVLKADTITIGAPADEVVLDEVTGLVSNLDAAAKTFTVGAVDGAGGVKVDFNGAVQFVGGAEADLALADANVRVQGVLSADGTVLVAQIIEFVVVAPAPAGR